MVQEDVARSRCRSRIKERKIHIPIWFTFFSQGRCRADMTSGGEGFGTERARGGFWGQFKKRNPFKRSFLKTQNFVPKNVWRVNFTKEFLFNEIDKFC